MNDFAHELSSPVDYHSGGENKQATSVVLASPSNKQRRPAAKLKQCFFRALNSFSDEQAQDQKDDSKPKGSAILALIMMSDVDIDEVHEAFKTLLTTGCAMLDGEVAMSNHHYDAIAFEDTEAMLGEYLVNFLIPS